MDWDLERWDVIWTLIIAVGRKRSGYLAAGRLAVPLGRGFALLGLILAPHSEIEEIVLPAKCLPNDSHDGSFNPLAILADGLLDCVQQGLGSQSLPLKRGEFVIADKTLNHLTFLIAFKRV